MNNLRLLLAGAAVSLLVCSGIVLAESGAIPTLARITMNLNHFPTDDEKAALTAIIESDDSSDEEAEIAMALVNMQHKVTEADAERLRDLVDDDEADASARKLAGILLGINHTPSEEDKAVLATLAAE